MRAIIFNGSLEKEVDSAAEILSSYLTKGLNKAGIDVQIFKLSEAGIPILDFSIEKIPGTVTKMVEQFTEADLHIWLSPLYHGSIPGAMKNCLDWLEITSKNTKPYLSDKTIGLICWADGMQAMQGINAMDAVAKALRAWPIPYSIPVIHGKLLDESKPHKISETYQIKLDRLVNIATTRSIAVHPK